MPTPRPGDGDLTYTLGQTIPLAVFYFAPYVAASVEPAPGVRLGNSEPGGNYVKSPLLKDDTFNVDDGDPDVVEYRRGFHQNYFGEVVRKKGQRKITGVFQETEPLAISNFLGCPITAGASPAGHKVNVGTSEQVAKTLLIVFFEALNDYEYHFYSPHCIAKFKFGKDAEFMVLNLDVKTITFKDSDNRYVDISYYSFDE